MKPIPVKIKSDPEYDKLTPLQKDIIEAAVHEWSEEEFREAMSKIPHAEIEEIQIDPEVVEELKKQGVSLEDFIKEFKEKAGLP